MASLRRIASLDTPPRSSSNPASCTNRLTRHSSLPNLSLCQPELSTNSALRKPSCKCSRHRFPFTIDSPSLHALPLCSKLPLCRALSSHSFGELPHFIIPSTPDAHNLFAQSVDPCLRCPSDGFHMSPRKEALLAAGKQSFDLEKSIVYTELKESMWKFEAPPRFLKPSDIEGNPCPATRTHIHTHIHVASKPMKSPNLCMESITNGVKGRPLSLRMLKKKLSQATPQDVYSTTPRRPSLGSKQLHEKCASQAKANDDSTPRVISDGYDSVSSAFASLFYILKMLQQYMHSLRVQSRTSVFDFDRSCNENLVCPAYVDMLDSFLWLFQQVFSGTPRLMLVTMVLLADFTQHSMSLQLAFPVRPLGEPPTPMKFPHDVEKSVVVEDAVNDANSIYRRGPEEKWKLWDVPSKNGGEFPHGGHSRGGGEWGHARTMHGDRDADDPCMPPTKGRAIVNGYKTHNGATFSSLSSPLHHVHEKQSELLSGCKEIAYDEPTKLLVAPVRAPPLEADDYPCFDLTDLAYQHEIRIDPNNPLLLSNYAQFLHLVRHDYDRAEELYRRAVSAEAEVDGDVMGRFANFLWVAKGDVAEADRAFKVATAADPTNAFHAGNYAHFLWNCSANQA